MANKKIGTPVCSHTSENLGVISPNQKLVPINGKITWHIDESRLPSGNLDKFRTIFAFEQAFKKWEQVLSPIVMEPTGDITKAQIVIRFRKNGDADLPFPFGQNVLAYAYAPHGTSLGIHSDMFFDLRWNWDDMIRQGSVLLFKVAVHEAGHVYNLSHSTDITDILYPIYQPNGEVVITKNTKTAIYNLYKEYGVKNPNAGNEVDPNPKTLSLKQLFSSKSDVGRLSLAQLSILNSFLSAGIQSKDRFDIRVTKIYNAIHRA